MISSPSTFRSTKRQAPCKGITLVQHNSMGSWDVFLSLFNSFVGLPSVEVVLLQDPPSRKGFLPSFTGFKSFCPPNPKPAVAFYVSLRFLFFHAVLPVNSPSLTEVFHLHIYTPMICGKAYMAMKGVKGHVRKEIECYEGMEMVVKEYHCGTKENLFILIVCIWAICFVLFCFV